jgi:hypothetical protein
MSELGDRVYEAVEQLVLARTALDGLPAAEAIERIDQATAILMVMDPDALPPPRTILIHLNVEVPGIVGSDANEVAAAVMAAIEVGSDDPSMAGFTISVALAEEV